MPQAIYQTQILDRIHIYNGVNKNKLYREINVKEMKIDGPVAQLKTKKSLQKCRRQTDRKTNRHNDKNPKKEHFKEHSEKNHSLGNLNLALTLILLG